MFIKRSSAAVSVFCGVLAVIAAGVIVLLWFGAPTASILVRSNVSVASAATVSGVACGEKTYVCPFSLANDPIDAGGNHTNSALFYQNVTTDWLGTVTPVAPNNTNFATQSAAQSLASCLGLTAGLTPDSIDSAPLYTVELPSAGELCDPTCSSQLYEPTPAGQMIVAYEHAYLGQNGGATNATEEAADSLALSDFCQDMSPPASAAKVPITKIDLEPFGPYAGELGVGPVPTNTTMGFYAYVESNAPSYGPGSFNPAVTWSVTDGSVTTTLPPQYLPYENLGSWNSSLVVWTVPTAVLNASGTATSQERVAITATSVANPAISATYVVGSGSPVPPANSNGAGQVTPPVVPPAASSSQSLIGASTSLSLAAVQTGGTLVLNGAFGASGNTVSIIMPSYLGGTAVGATIISQSATQMVVSLANVAPGSYEVEVLTPSGPTPLVPFTVTAAGFAVGPSASSTLSAGSGNCTSSVDASTLLTLQQSLQAINGSLTSDDNLSSNTVAAIQAVVGSLAQILQQLLVSGSTCLSVPPPAASSTDSIVPPAVTSTVSSIVITAPLFNTGTSTEAQGQNVAISWMGGPSSVNVELFQHGAQVALLANNIANEGSYSWTIPDVYAGSGFQIVVGPAGGVAAPVGATWSPGESGVFTIVSSSVMAL